jgi:hypothetical protein
MLGQARKRQNKKFDVLVFVHAHDLLKKENRK